MQYNMFVMANEWFKHAQCSALPLVYRSQGQINMGALLLVCILVKQNATVRFIWTEGVESAETDCKLLAQHGREIMTQ